MVGKKDTKSKGKKTSLKNIKIKKTKKTVKPKSGLKSKVKPIKKTTVKKKVSSVKKPTLKKKIKAPLKTQLKENKNIYYDEFKHASLEKRYKSRFIFKNYNSFILFTLFVLLFIIFCDFLIKFVVYTSAPALVIYNTQNTMFYTMYNLFFLLTFFLIYFLFAYIGVIRNIPLNSLLKSVFSVSLFLFIIETIVLLVSYFTFLESYYSVFGISSVNAISGLFVWILIKYFLLIFVTFIAYKILQRFKERYLWH